LERERQVAGREQRLAEREAEMHDDRRTAEQALYARERAALERDAQLARREEEWRAQHLAERQELLDRQADLAGGWKELSQRQEEWRAQQIAEKDDLEATALELERASASFREEEAHIEKRLREEEERLREVRRVLDERDLRWAEACKDATVARAHVPRARLTPRSAPPGKENQELQRQLEEQAHRMQQIKRNGGSWHQSGLDAAPPCEGRRSSSSSDAKSFEDSACGEDATPPSDVVA